MIVFGFIRMMDRDRLHDITFSIEHSNGKLETGTPGFSKFKYYYDLIRKYSFAKQVNF
jgi:hypothetical protein